MQDKSKSSAQGSYSSSLVLQRYLQQKLNLEKIRKSTKNAGNKLSKTDSRIIKVNDKKKVNVLNNHIFRSMANIVYFFEFIYNHQELEGIFDDDVEELLGFQGSHVKRHKMDDDKYLVFLRLLALILDYDNDTLTVKEQRGKIFTERRVRKITMQKKKEFDISRNIRLQAISTTVDIALKCIQKLAAEQEGETLSMKHLKIYKILNQDFERTNTWKDYYCTSQIKLNVDEPHRKIGF